VPQDLYDVLQSRELEAEMERRRAEQQRPSPMAGAVLGHNSPAYQAIEIARRNAETAPRTVDMDPEGLGILGTAAGLVLGGLIAPASPAAAMLTQFAVGGGIDLGVRAGQGQPMREAIPDALRSGRDAAIMEGGARVVGAAAKPAGELYSAAKGKLLGAAGRTRTSVSGGRMNAPLRPYLTDPATSSEQVIRTANELGVVVPPAHVVDHNIVDTGYAIARSAIFGGQTIRSAEKHTMRRASDAMREAANYFPRFSREQVVSLVGDLASGRLKTVKGIAQGYFRAVDEAMGAGNHMVDISPIKAKVAEYAAKAAGSKAGGLFPLPRAYQEIMSKPDVVPYEQAHRIRSDLFDISQQETIGLGAEVTREKRDAVALLDLAGRQIDSAVAKAPREVRETLDRANRIWREEVKGEFTTRFVQKLTQENAVDIADAISRMKPGEARMIRDVIHRTPDGKAAWETVQGHLIHKMLWSASQDVTTSAGRLGRGGVVDGAAWQRAVQKMQGQDGLLWNEVMRGKGDEVARNMNRYANVLSAVQRGPQGSGTGAIFFNMLQAGAVAGAIGGSQVAGADSSLVPVLTVGGAAVLLGPKALARIMTSRTMSNWLSIGTAATPGSQSAIRAAIGILGGLLQEGDYDGDREAAEAALRSAQEQVGIRPGAGLDLRATPTERSSVERAQTQSFDQWYQSIVEGKEQPY
jgi:hypothetical protein